MSARCLVFVCPYLCTSERTLWVMSRGVCEWAPTGLVQHWQALSEGGACITRPGTCCQHYCRRNIAIYFKHLIVGYGDGFLSLYLLNIQLLHVVGHCGGISICHLSTRNSYRMSVTNSQPWCLELRKYGFWTPGRTL